MEEQRRVAVDGISRAQLDILEDALRQPDIDLLPNRSTRLEIERDDEGRVERIYLHLRIGRGDLRKPAIPVE